jgi:hypothetical protein
MEFMLLIVPFKAGLNLNIFGALSGAFSSKSKKTTHKNADGSSEVVEEGEGRGKSYAHLLLPLLLRLFNFPYYTLPTLTLTLTTNSISYS